MTQILIVSAQFYPDLAREMSRGAQEILREAGAAWEEIHVPGAFEIPAAIGFAVASRKYDGFIALGCVIRGETTHYDYVCQESARGLMDLSLQGAAIGYGILTVENLQQAQARAGIGKGNKGAQAALACLHMIDLRRGFKVIA